MLNFLGVESNFSVLAGMAWTSSFLFRSDTSGAAYNLDGVTFKGSVFEQSEKALTFTRATADAQKNVIEVGIPALREGRWRYAITATDDSGASTRLLSGFVTALGSLPTMNNDSYAKRTLLLRMPDHAGEKLQVEWAATTVAEFYSGQSKANADKAEAQAKASASSATSAAASASAAKTSENNAKNSATAAKNSENAAAASATKAKESETHAANSATSAGLSSSAALESANKAKASETAAAASAKTATDERKLAESAQKMASGYADDAKASAREAKAAAQDAEGSQSAVKADADRATTAAKNAETYASRARASENQASQYASNASSAEKRAASHMQEAEQSASNAANAMNAAEDYATDAENSAQNAADSEKKAFDWDSHAQSMARQASDYAKRAEDSATAAQASEDSVEANATKAKNSETKAESAAERAEYAANQAGAVTGIDISGYPQKSDLDNAATAWDIESLQEKYKAGSLTKTYEGEAPCSLYWFQIGEQYLSDVQLISDVTLYCRANLREIETKDPFYLGIWQEQGGKWVRVATSLNTQTQTNGGVLKFNFLPTPISGNMRFCPLSQRFDKWPSPPTLYLGLLVSNSSSIVDENTYCRVELETSINPHYLPKISVEYAAAVEPSESLPEGNTFENPIIGKDIKNPGKTRTVLLGQNIKTYNTSDSTAVGYGVEIAAGAVGIGAQAMPLSSGSIAIGNHAVAEGYSSIAIGDDAQSNRCEYSITIGPKARNPYAKTALIKVGNNKNDTPPIPADDALRVYFYGPTSELASNTGDKAGIAYSVGNTDPQCKSFEDLFAGGGGSATLPIPMGTGAGDRSFYIGEANNVSGARAIAIGESISAQGDDSISITTEDGGTNGDYSIAIGHKAATNDVGAIALGSGSNGQGARSIAIGVNCTVTAPKSIGIGGEAKASGSESVTIGDVASSQNYSVSIGYAATAGGMYSIAIGNSSKASSTSSIVIGLQSTASQQSSIVIGSNASNTHRDSALVKVGVSSQALNFYVYGTASDLATNTDGKPGMAYYEGTSPSSAKYISLEQLFSGGGGSTLPEGGGGTGESSVAIGENAIASGASSIAIGEQTAAVGDASIVLGARSTVNKEFGIAIGDSAIVESSNSIAIGHMAKVTYNSIAIGFDAQNTYAETVLIQIGEAEGVLKLYFFGPNSELSTNTESEAGIGYVCGEKSGCIKLSALLTNAFRLK